MFSAPIASYQKISFESEVRGADPRHLITLLFDGAETALNTAQAQLANNDLRGKSESITKAIAIIVEGLSASLNLNEGGELAHNLAALYDYMVTRLVYANIHKDAVAIHEVQGLLSEIGGAWKIMGTDAAGGNNP
jgi:flagellar protein FliS